MLASSSHRRNALAKTGAWGSNASMILNSLRRAIDSLTLGPSTLASRANFSRRTSRHHSLAWFGQLINVGVLAVRNQDGRVIGSGSRGLT
jgi:hypothetical protein